MVRLAGVYYVVSLDKCGRMTNLKDGYSCREQYKNLKAYILSIFDRYPQDLLDKLYQKFVDIYELIKFESDEEHDNWDYDAMMEWSENNGLSPHFRSFMHNIPKRIFWKKKLPKLR